MPGLIALAFVAANEFYEVLGATPTLVKGTAATWFQIEVDNTPNTGIVYLKGWFAATAGAVPPGTTVADMVLPYPAGQKFSWICPTGNAGTTGLVVAVVTGKGTASTTAPATSVVTRIAYN